MALSSDYLEVSKVSSLFSFQFALRIRIAFAIQYACVFLRRSIDRRTRPSRIPRNFSPFLCPGSRVWLVFLTFVSRLTYECPVVTARPILSATARELHENRAEKVSPCTWMSQVNIHLVYADLLRANANATCERAYVIIVAAHVVSRIFRPRIPFSILAKVATTVLRTSCIKFACANSTLHFVSKKKLTLTSRK